MGKILQILVTAWTYREEDLPETWPNIVKFVWPMPPYSGEKRGVLELVTALDNKLAFGECPEYIKHTLQKEVAEIVAIKKNLEKALSDWKPVEADTFSYTLEDQLTELELKLTDLEKTA